MALKVNSKLLSLYMVFALGLFLLSGYYAVRFQSYEYSGNSIGLAGSVVSDGNHQSGFHVNNDIIKNIPIEKKAALAVVFFLVMIFTARIALGVFEMGHWKRR